jgi:hypothetical protein
LPFGTPTIDAQPNGKRDHYHPSRLRDLRKEDVTQLLTWTTVGVEGVVFKRLNEPYRPGTRAWSKYKVRETTEAIVGAVTGHRSVPRTLLLGRYDDQERLQYIGRTTTLPRAAGALVGELLTTVRAGHPWTGWSFSAGWGRRETLDGRRQLG